MSADLPRSIASTGGAASADRLPLATLPPRPRRQRLLLNALRLALFAAALVALHREIAGVDRVDVVRALRSYGWPQIALALLCTAASFVILGAVELLAIRDVDAGRARAMPRRAAFATAFVSHALSQSAGFGLLTGAAVRLRAYARYGIDARAVARTTTTVIASIFVALVALVALGAVAFAGSPPMSRAGLSFVPDWRTGALVGAIAAAGVVIIVLGRRSRPNGARSRFTLPPMRIAASQVALCAIDWLVTAAVFAAFVPASSSTSSFDILRAFVLAHAAGAASQVPGGAGVLDVTLLALVAPGASPTMRGALAASIVAYRVTYYLVPLCAATLTALVWEARRARRSDEAHTITRTLPFQAPMSTERRGGAREAELEASRAGAAHRLEWLIDNADAYDRLLGAIRGARRSVWIAQLAFDADCVIYARLGSSNGGAETVLATALIELAATATVDIRILLNENFLQNTLRAFRRSMGDAIAARGLGPDAIRVRGLKRFPYFLHVKMAIVDGTEAFLLGSPFVNGYWDDARHPPMDARRPDRELSGRPLHDVSVRVGGRAVRHLESLFAGLWNNADAGAQRNTPGDDTIRLTHARRPREMRGDTVHVVRTLPRRILPEAPGGATEVLDALLDGLAHARRLIYIEHQYLTARPAVAALLDALRRVPDLEVVIVVNQNPDLTAYRGWQNARLAESGLLAHPRVGIFTLWSAASSDGRPDVTAINQVFVHSKVVTIDDQWALVGAANLDGLSLHSYGDDFAGRAARRIFRHVRNFEVSLVVRDGDGTAGAVADLRMRLWSEHLGMPQRAIAQRSARGWLALWRTRAADNVRTLSPGADPAPVRPHMRGFVLPYSMRATPAEQLADVGVHVDPARLNVRFDPGWLEVHLSAGWVRNIFV